MEDILQNAMKRLAQDEDFVIVYESFILPNINAIKDITEDFKAPEGVQDTTVENLVTARIISYKVLKNLFDDIFNQKDKANVIEKKRTRYK